MKNLKVLDNKNIIGVRCHAYFRGVDGVGICNTDCQWWRDTNLKSTACPMWIERSKWGTDEDIPDFIEWAKNHYWDSLEKDRNLIIKHIESFYIPEDKEHKNGN